MAIELYELKDIAIKSSAGNELAIDASGYITANQGGSWTVASTQSGSWSVDAVQSGSWTVGVSGTVAVTQSGTWDVGRTWTLSSGTDSVSCVQSGTWTVTAAKSAFTAWKTTNTTVNATAVQLVSTALTDRKYIVVQNVGDKAIYLSIDNTVSSTNGVYLPKGSQFELDLDAGAQIWAIAASAGGAVVILEAA